jgi:hypothetical protein
MLNEEIKNIVINGTPAQRKYIFSKPEGFIYFCMYYFPEYYTYLIPDFHYDMYQDLEDLTNLIIFYLLWFCFRESSKTTIAKMYICWAGATQQKHYINYDSYDKTNSELALYDVAIWFQTNRKIIADYGQLYFETGQKKSKLKRINNFVLANGVKYEAFSTQTSLRGRVYMQYRPDLIVCDDIETNKTKKSVVIVKSIISHFDEMFSGISPNANMIVLGNYISDSGVIQYLKDKAKGNPRFRERQVNVEKEDGSPQWDDKYAKTDFEAEVRNVERPKDNPVVSLESKKKDLGERVYNTEMMNQPESGGTPFFNREMVDEAIKKCKEPIQTLGGLKMWYEFDSSCRYAEGADVGKGVGRDSSTGVVMNFTTVPNRVVATYKDNQKDAKIHAHELKRHGHLYGECLIAPECNNTVGGTCVNELSHIYPIDRIYQQRGIPKGVAVKVKYRNELGWETNGATKPEMFIQFRNAWEKGLIEILDKDLLEEMRRYGTDDLETNDTDADETITRHFDLLTGACIAWAMRNDAMVSDRQEKDDEHYEQPPPEQETQGSYD